MTESHSVRLERTLNELKDYAETVVAIKAKGDSSGQLPAACAAGTALLLRAREQERLAVLQLAALKDGNASQRSTLDHDSLQLHNLVYEQQYYDKEIAASRAFKSAYTNEQVGCDPANRPDHQSESDMLHAELQERQALQQQLQQLQQQKEQLLNQRNKVSTNYAELRQQVEQCHVGNLPLVEATQPSRSNLQADSEAAQLLPLPLYIIYTQAAAAANVVGLPLIVSIEGNPAVAKQQLQQQQLQQQQQQQGLQAAGDDAEAAGTQDAKRKRKHLQQENTAYQLHPLSVRLEIKAPAQAGATTLTFYYYTQLKLVGVLASAPEDQELITNLFLGDVGDGALLENIGMCSSSGALDFATAGRPCPFRWAQELGGVDVLASLPSSLTGVGSDPSQVLSALAAYRSSLRLETFLDRLLEAQQGRTQLKRILEQLASKEQPACSLGAKYLAAIRTYIHSWKHLSDVGVQLLGAQEQLQLEAAATRSHVPAWRPGQQQLSIQEEGEVEGEGEGADTTSLLLPGETADEDLLQGLLEDDRMGGGEEPQEQQGAQGMQQQGEAGHGGNAQQGQQARAAQAENGTGAGDGDGEYNGLQDEFGELLAEEASMGSELLTGEGGGDGGGLGASGPGRTLQAAHSLYRLVLRATALEVHLHVKLFYSYPLCPPVFSVTKMLDTSSRGDAVPLTDVNEVLQLQQQANSVAVQDSAATGRGEMLAVQVLRLRLYVDAMSSQLRNQHSKDLVDNLKAKQALQGRDRLPGTLLL